VYQQRARPDLARCAGCIRMRDSDSDIAWLAPRVTLGTPVDIVR
jgi:lipoprotein-anchoring transpeptidase ErfK/SrfK